MKKCEMTADDVLNIIKLLKKNDIEVYIDGGWAVDAVLGEITRPHEDLDIAIPHKFTPQLRELLAAHGYKEIFRDDSWECNYVLCDDFGHIIDVHSYVFDENGNNVFGVPYEKHHLVGSGMINSYAINCVTPNALVEFHTGYDVDEGDYKDVKALCDKFNITMPDDYKKFNTII